MSCRSVVVALTTTVLVLTTMIVSGCTQSPGVGDRLPTGPPAQPSSAQPSSVPTSVKQSAELAAQKRQSGIVDCPTSDPTVAPVTGGLPDIVLPCLGGGRDVRLAGLRGRPMMVNVWAQWCPPCRAEAPYLRAVANDNSSDLMILGLDVGDGVQPDLAIEFAARSGWTFPQVADTDWAIKGPLQILGPPYSFFVRPDGTIAHRHAGGFTSTAQIRALARQHLGVDL